MVIFNTKLGRSGGAALELLVALAVLVFAVSSSIVVVFGNQSVSVDTETNSEAVAIAEKILGEARADSKEDFHSVNSVSVAQSIYQTELNVLDVTPCIKRVTSETSWNASPSRELNITLSTVFTDIAGALALGGDCGGTGGSSSGWGSPWDNPGTLSSTNLNPPGLKATDVNTALIGGKRWVFLTSYGNQNQDDFWIIDLDTVSDPEVVASLNAGGCRQGGGPNQCGFNAVDVAGNFAYLANASSTDDSSSHELIIIDISDPLNPQNIGSATLGITPNCPGTYCPGGAQAIYYYDSKAYVGTHRTGGHEFHIFDVSDPADPVHIGSEKIDRNINDIVVRNGLAYLATSASSPNEGENLLIYDVSNPTSITKISSFFAEGNEDGQALYLLGNNIYLGRDRAPCQNQNNCRPDFYIIDISNPTNPVELGAKNLDMNPNTSVAGIAVGGNMAFIATTDQTKSFQVWDISDPSNIKAPSACNVQNFTGPGSEEASGVALADNTVFVSNESGQALRIIENNTSSACQQ